MSKELSSYKEKVIHELRGLPKEKIDEVIDFIGYLKLKQNRKKRKSRIITPAIQDNPLLSVIGIGESDYHHDLAENHDKYIYSDL